MSKTFTDLEIRIFEQSEAGYPVEITLDGQQEFPRGFLAKEAASWVASGDPATDGQQLFDLLFADATLRSAWAEARGRASHRRIRLRIDVGAAELHALPWELAQEGDVLLAARAETPFSRYLPVALPWRGPVGEEPVRVLAVLANPADLASAYSLTPLDAAQEQAVLRKAFTALSSSQVQLDFLAPPVTLKRLEEKLREGYHILHYVGHGAFSKSHRQAALYLQDEAGQTHVVQDDAFIGMLARQPVRPNLVFLAACHSATRATSDAFLGLGPKLVAAGVPAVVAMQDVVSLETARVLSETFYQRLAEHGVIDRAMNEARSTLVTAGRPDAAIPVLFMRLKSGQLWGSEADVRGVVLGAKPQTFWEGMISNIEYGECLPIIGPRVHGRWLPQTSEIAAQWSDKHIYPFLSKDDLSHVAQYLASYHGDLFPRRELLAALKDEFIRRLPEDARPTGYHVRRTLTDLIQEVGWQTLVADNPNDVHRILASLALPLYLTTNPDNFMAEALAARANGAAQTISPVREFCRWDIHLDQHTSRLAADEVYEPSTEAPLVYHLFGSDEELNSLVITEDDYLRFLVRVTAERDRIPNMIREALSSKSLMFIGYNLYDWEFRVLLHGVVGNLDQRLGFKHVAVQLDFKEAGDADTAAVHDFLERYFNHADINVFWGSPAQFAAELREHWEAAQ